MDEAFQYAPLADMFGTWRCYSHLIHLKPLIPITEKEAVLDMENDFKPAQFIEFDAKEK